MGYIFALYPVYILLTTIIQEPHLRNPARIDKFLVWVSRIIAGSIQPTRPILSSVSSTSSSKAMENKTVDIPQSDTSISFLPRFQGPKTQASLLIAPRTTTCPTSPTSRTSSRIAPSGTLLSSTGLGQRDGCIPPAAVTSTTAVGETRLGVTAVFVSAGRRSPAPASVASPSRRNHDAVAQLDSFGLISLGQAGAVVDVDAHFGRGHVAGH